MSWSAEEVENVVERLMQALNDAGIPQLSHYERRKVYLTVCAFAAQQKLLPHEATEETIRVLVALVKDMPTAWQEWTAWRTQVETEDYQINVAFWIDVSDLG